MFFGLLKLFKSFSKKEWVVFIVACVVFVASFSLFAANIVEEKTTLVAVEGGKYFEGGIGQPVYINPVLAINDIDRDLVELLFSNLNTLAQNYKISDDGKTWRYRLKDGLTWHDGQSITADDIIFTVEAMQDPDTYSPFYQSWQGVKANRISEREVEFVLPQPYVFFKNTLEEARPIPKHIFGNIPFANFKLSNYNLEPIGSGPFKFESYRKKADGFISAYNLIRNENYFERAYLQEFNFIFYNNDSDVIDAFNIGSIDGFGSVSGGADSLVYFPHNIYSLRMLKYYALFFNQYSHQALRDKNVKLALDYATDKNKIIEQVFKGQAVAVSGPLVEGANDFFSDVYFKDEYSIDKANAILDESGWQKNSEGIREKAVGKDMAMLEFDLTVPDTKFLIDTANIIKDDWIKAGIKLNISVFSVSRINNDIIKNRDYQMMLFGNIVGDSSDLFSFWHSSERFYPGFNLALYSNNAADNLIETIRRNFDNEKRKSNLATLQSLIIQDQPALFIYSPNYLYISKKKMGGFSEKAISLPSDRLKTANKWFVNTVRVMK